MPLKICLLAPSSSVHTLRWVNSLSQYENLSIYLITQDSSLCQPLATNAKLIQLPISTKIGYLFNCFHLKRIVRQIKPDILHVHYASGYGTLAALAFSGNYILSVWGSDVYDFPAQCWLSKKLIKYNLLRDSLILSTSQCMADQAKKILGTVNKDIKITPFGADIRFFDSFNQPQSHKSLNDEIVIGTVKKLAPKYGIDTLIQAFKLVTQELSHLNLVLHIVGDGPSVTEYKKLVQILDLESDVIFIPFVPNHKVPEILSHFTIFAALSRLDSESFGVAAVEAQAMGIPVVVSDVDGFKEVVSHKDSGIIVRRDNIREAANAIILLIKSPALRTTLARKARMTALAKYFWPDNVRDMVKIYEDFIK